MKRETPLVVALRLRGTIPACLFLAAGLLAAPAHAWNIEVGMGAFEDSVYFSTYTGDAPQINLLQEGVYANHGVGTFDSTPQPFPPDPPHAWNGSDWPSDALEQVDDYNGVYSQATISHSDTSDPYPDYLYCYVYGDVAPGYAHGSGWSVDFDIVLAPFTSGTLILSPSDTYASMESAIGDTGFAFGTVKLYDPTVDLDAPAGANDPYDSDTRYILAASDVQEVSDSLSLSQLFVNNTASPLTFHLRLQGTTSVYESAVPEPASAALIALGSLTLLHRRKH